MIPVSKFPYETQLKHLNLWTLKDEYERMGIRDLQNGGLLWTLELSLSLINVIVQQEFETEERSCGYRSNTSSLSRKQHCNST